MIERGHDAVYRSSLLGAQGWLEHGFGTRLSENWPGDYARVRQTHSATVVVTDRITPWADSPEGDAVLSSTSGLWVGIRTADCVPVLVADPVHRAVLAIHAGWRGTAVNIVAAGVTRLGQVCGSKPQDLIVAIGPAIGRCCFEVGPEVAREFETWFPEAASPANTIDLPEGNRRQLIALGVQRANIDVLAHCTKCSGAEFHSWRRDRDASGRMVSAIRVKPEA